MTKLLCIILLLLFAFWLASVSCLVLCKWQVPNWERVKYSRLWDGKHHWSWPASQVTLCYCFTGYSPILCHFPLYWDTVLPWVVCLRKFHVCTVWISLSKLVLNSRHLFFYQNFNSLDISDICLECSVVCRGLTSYRCVLSVTLGVVLCSSWSLFSNLSGCI